MPNSFTNKMFSLYVNATYTPTSSGELHVIDPGGGTFFILVQMQGNNNDHMSFHIFQNAGLYVKTLNTITQINYQNNTSINIEPASSGKPGFNIKLNYTSLYGGVQVHIFKLK